MPSVSPLILEWARSSAGLSVEEAAHALGITSSDRLEAIEAGEQIPSRSLLLKMSKRYHRSLLTFYLAKPPRRGDHGEDFRTTTQDRSIADDALLDALIRDIKARQSLVRSTLEEDEEQAPLDFIGSIQMIDGLATILRSIQDTMKIDLSAYRKCKTVESAFSYLRERAESIGIFVLLAGNLGSHHSAIPVEIFRGFTIADPIAPFVVINDQDAKTAWSFTLIHEIAHLWLGSTGVSGAYADLAIEQLCNDVAGELLLPRNELDSLRIGNDIGVEEAISLISGFASARYVSRQMVTYRLYRAGVIPLSTWRLLDTKLREIWLYEKARRKDIQRPDSGPSYYVIRRHRLGNALLAFASRNISAGTLSPAKAAKVLGVKPRSVSPLLLDIRSAGAAH